MTARDGTTRHYRPIRSFVRRTGRLTASQRRALEALWPRYGVEFEHRQLDLDGLFGRRAARVLEIGFGNGETLVQQAVQHPSLDFIGIDVHEPGIGHCLIEAGRVDAVNLRLIAHDAIEVLEAQIPTNSLCRINLYFPDPWPKKRHHKRRIVKPSFVELCADRLESGGSLFIATDWADYAERIDEIVAESSAFTCVERREHGGDSPLDRPVTKFERRGLHLGHRIWDWHFARL